MKERGEKFSKMETEPDRGSSLADKISREINNPEFLEQLETFPDDIRDETVGQALQYLTIFKEEPNLGEYMEEVQDLSSERINSFRHEMGRSKIIIDHVAEKLGLGDVESMEDKNKIYEFIAENYIEDGYFFHGFSGVFEESIQENGLDPSIRDWNREEMDRIEDICSNAGKRNILGWAHINSEGNIFVGDEPNNIYRYAIASPEWFNQFVAGGPHIRLDEPYDKKAYYKKDYEAARKNIEAFCDEMMSRDEKEIEKRKAYPNITKKEREEVLNFFEKYWEKLVKKDANPKCALVERKEIDEDIVPYDSYEDYYKAQQEYGFSNPSIESAVNLLLSSDDIDLGIDRKIDNDSFVIVDLPEYKDVHK
ncbi:MAG: hypothetical protein ABEJ24_02595 [Candidatus Magasanikbacteria bacterium]